MPYSINTGKRLAILKTESDSTIKEIVFDSDYNDSIIFTTKNGCYDGYIKQKESDTFYGCYFVKCKDIYQIRYHIPRRFSRGDTRWISFENRDGDDITLYGSVDCLIMFEQYEEDDFMQLVNLLINNGFRVING